MKYAGHIISRYPHRRPR